jgi:hypothetical protein
VLACPTKAEIRNPNIEARNNDQMFEKENPKQSSSCLSHFRHLVIRICFEIRASDLLLGLPASIFEKMIPRHENR